MSRGRRGLALGLTLALALPLGGCAVWDTPSASSQIFVMDTVVTLTVYAGDEETAQDQVDQAAQALYHLEDLWSVTDEGSEVWALNHGGGAWVDLSPETVELLSQALALCALTDGALDITSYPAVRAWGFTTGEYRMPGEAERAALAADIDYTQVELDRENSRARLPEGMELDLGAVAKGYAGALLARQLEEAGVTSALLNLGGNVQTVGEKPGGAPWEVGVRDPAAQEAENLAALSVAGLAVVTSGNYQRYFERDGQRYWHIMDPDTAAPARTGLDSVTVVGEDGLVCDGLATALFVLGEERGAQLWRDHPELDVQILWVREDGSLAMTQGLEDSSRLNEQLGAREVTVIS